MAKALCERSNLSMLISQIGSPPIANLKNQKATSSSSLGCRLFVFNPSCRFTSGLKEPWMILPLPKCSDKGFVPMVDLVNDCCELS